MAKRQRWKEGTIVAIPLADCQFAYGQLLAFPEIAVFGDISRDVKSAADVIRSEVLFRVWIMRDTISQGHWEKIGEAPIPPSFEIPEPRCKRDPISGQLSICVETEHGLQERLATTQECRGMETAAVWSKNHVEDRILDHLAGQPNKWVESLRVA